MDKRPVKLWFCDFWHAEDESAIRRVNPLYQLLSKAFEITLDSQSPDFLIYSCDMAKAPRFCRYSCPRIYYTGENLPPDRLECDYSFSFEPDSERNFRLPYYLLTEGFAALLQKPGVNILPRHLADKKQRFCSFIYRNHRCPQRNDFFHILNGMKKVDAAGKLFNNTGGLAARESENWNETKLKFIESYKFTIAFENESFPGYVTEKITDAFAAGSIPVYWGCPDIAKEFNPAAFINCHDFSSLEEAAEHVIKVDNDEKLYFSYLSASPFLDSDRTHYERVNNRFSEIFSETAGGSASLSLYSRFIKSIPPRLAKRIVKKRRKILKKQKAGAGHA